MIQTIKGILTLGFCTAFLLSCDSEGNESHDVTVTWQMSGVSSCQSPALPGGEILDFDTIQIDVYKDDTKDEDPIRVAEVDCEDYAYTIEGLRRGAYYVELGAIAVFQGDELPFFQASGDIDSPAEDDEYTFQLMIGTGSVEVSWGFVQGLCGPNGVDTVNINLEGDIPNNNSTHEDIACDDGVVLIEDLVWDTYTLTVEGFDGDGVQTHLGETGPFEVKPGQIVTGDAFVELLEI